jgi:hypothetical protein
VVTFSLQILTSKPLAALPFTGRGFLISLHVWLQKSGGGCHGVVTESSVSAEVSCMNREEVMSLIDAFVISLAKTDPDVRVVVNDRVTGPLGTAGKELAESLNMPPKKLTLKFLQSLPSGSYLVSNLWTEFRIPVFEEFVAPLEARKDQWKRIIATGAAQRTCHMFPSKEAFDRWLDASAI